MQNKKIKVIKALCNLLVFFSLAFNSIVYASTIDPCIASKEAFQLKTHKKNQEIQVFMDKFFNENMRKNNVPGAGIVVVRDGKIIFKKGYGYANIERRIPVDPDKTVFKSASVSKLFTGTAILQLYDKGLIRLDDDVNDYLTSFQVENEYSKPVTFANLLLHTSGIDEGSEIGCAYTNISELPTYEDFMKSHVPKVVKEPEATTRYVNSGYNLLGYLIEKISGVSYQSYVKDNILNILSMRNSSVLSISEDMAIPYYYKNGNFNVNKYSYSPALGSSGINSTVVDMANFMIAHLQNGNFQGNKLFTQETAKLMHKQHFTNNPMLPGMAFSFIESYRNNQRILKHEGGEVDGFTTSLFLIPEQNIGFYVATNSLNALPFQLENEFLNHYYPVDREKLSIDAPTNFMSTTYKYTGVYRSYENFSKNNIMKMAILFSPDNDMKITDNGDGTLSINGFSVAKESVSTSMIKVKPLLFKRKDNNSYFAFRKNDKGDIIYAFNDSAQMSFEKLRWYETLGFNWLFLGIYLSIFIFTYIFWSIRFIRCDTKRRSSNSSKLAKATIALAFFLNTMCFIGIISMFMYISYDIIFGLPVIFYVLLLGLNIGAILSIITMILNFLVWKKRYWTLGGRIHYTVLSLTSIAFVWFLTYWNMIGFNL